MLVPKAIKILREIPSQILFKFETGKTKLTAFINWHPFLLSFIILFENKLYLGGWAPNEQPKTVRKICGKDIHKKRVSA